MFTELNERVSNVTKSYELEHEAEEWLFEEVGTLVGTVWKETKEMINASANVEKGTTTTTTNDDNDFGKRESVKLVLAKAARGLHAARTMLKAHLAKESAHVLPLLKQHFTEDEQSKLIWSFLEKFPVQKIVAILKWVFAARETEEYLESLEMYLRVVVKISPEAMALKTKLLKLIEDNKGTNEAELDGNEEEEEEDDNINTENNNNRKETIERTPLLSLLFEDDHSIDNNNNEEIGVVLDDFRLATTTTTNPPTTTTTTTKKNSRRNRNRHQKSSKTKLKNKKLPIDHIFQFHDALRVELNRMEAEILQLPTDGMSASDAKLVREIEGRFVFLQGVYEAHSKSEDEVVFPQLEKKKALVNVSHSYTLDHEQEAELFQEMLSLIEKLKKNVNREIAKESRIKSGNNSSKKRQEKKNSNKVARNNEDDEDDDDDSGTIVRKLQETCVALKVSLETHVKNEEDELWPLFEEHFTIKEQEALVGLIIGQTGAEVLRAMLDWVRKSLDSEEALVMMANMKQATENTRFAKWLNTWMTGEDPEATRVLGLKKRGATSDDDDDVNDDRALPKEKQRRKKEAKKRRGTAAAETAATNNNNNQRFVTMNVVDNNHNMNSNINNNIYNQNNTNYESEDEISDATTATNTHLMGGVQQVNEYFDTLRRTKSAEKLLSGDTTSEDTTNNNEQGSNDIVFRPGWSDIFKMNQRQLESAIHILNRDDTLAPSRKAYLMQNLLASRWITGNQRITENRMNLEDLNIARMNSTSADSNENTNTNNNSENNMTTTASKISNFLIRGGGIKSIKSTTPADNEQQQQHQPVVCYACPSESQSASEHNASKSGCLGCTHYHRKCKLVPECCNVPFTCRFCHDDNSDHAMDRYKTKEMQCMKCATIQPVAKSCLKCKIEMAKYFCDICKLFDDLCDGRDIYHCPFCNVCRKGRGLGKDFFHCMTCNSCVSLVMGPHECLGKRSSMESECPVCKDFMFDSETPVKTLPCGHLMHTSCFETYTKHYYTCPLCRKSLGDFTVYFRMLDAILADEQKNNQLNLLNRDDCTMLSSDAKTDRNKKQRVKCNDCEQVSMADYHFVYHACGECKSYNTVVWVLPSEESK